MPDGKTHEKVNFLLTVSIPVGALFIEPGLAPGVFLGMATSCVITPDLLDVDGDPVPEWRLRKIPILGIFYAWVFSVVANRIPHRSWLSHSPVGTILSLVLLWWLPLLCWWVGGWLSSHPASDAGQRTGHGLLWGFLLGKLAGDMVHVLLDVVVSGIKRFVRRLKGKRWERVMSRRETREVKRDLWGDIEGK